MQMYEITVRDIMTIRDIVQASRNQYEAFIAVLEYGIRVGAERA